jgi:cytochrome c-type biogenesis protein
MPDVTVYYAFTAGIISFLSPCVLPLVPGYISIVSGFSLDQLQSGGQDKSLMRAVLLNSVMFIIGFSITFILLGATATWLGQVLVVKKRIFEEIAGVLIIVFGIHLTGIYKINFLYQDKRFHSVNKPRGLFGALLLGLAFAFGWSPCIGPILATVITMASEKQTVGQGIFLLAVYSMGLGLPFLLTSLGLNKFLSFYSKFKRHFHTMEVISGVLVIIVGVLILTNRLTQLNGYFSFLTRFEKFM